MEISTVQHQDKTKAVPELCWLHPSVRLRILENDSKPPYQTISLLHKELEKNKKSIVAKHHLKRRVTCAVSSREHGHHSHEKAMEMDRVCAQKKTQQHHTRSPPLDTRRKEKKRKTQEHLAQSCGGRVEDP